MRTIGSIAASLLLLAGVAKAVPAGVSAPPAQPLPLNTFAFVGTSREQQQGYFSYNTSWQYFNWANWLGGQKYQLVFNDAISGYTSRQFFAGAAAPGQQGVTQYGIGLAGAIASPARFVVFGGVVNDPASYTGDQVWDNTVAGAEPGIGYLQAAQQVIAAGKTPVLQLEYGQNGLTTLAKIVQIARYNQLAREFCASSLAVCLDFPSAIQNPTTSTVTYAGGVVTAATINLVANSTADGTHTNQLGGYLLGKVFDATLGPLVPPGPSLPAAPSDQSLPNNLFVSQSGGSVSGGMTLTSGAVPAGYQIQGPAGVSVASSFAPDPGGYGYDWTLTITNGAGANPTIYITATTALQASAGAMYQAGGIVATAAGATAYVGASFGLALYFTGGNYQVGDFATQPQALTGPGIAYSATMKTFVTPNVLTSATGSNSPYLVLQPTFVGNGTATITLSRLWVRQL